LPSHLLASEPHLLRRDLLLLLGRALVTIILGMLLVSVK